MVSTSTRWPDRERNRLFTTVDKNQRPKLQVLWCCEGLLSLQSSAQTTRINPRWQRLDAGGKTIRKVLEGVAGERRVPQDRCFANDAIASCSSAYTVMTVSSLVRRSNSVKFDLEETSLVPVSESLFCAKK